MYSIWSIEFTKLKVISMRTQDSKSGDLSSRFRHASAHNVTLDKLDAYFWISVCPVFIMRRLEQMSQRDLFCLEYYLT